MAAECTVKAAAEVSLLQTPLEQCSEEQLDQYSKIGNRILKRANQAELFADFSGKDDLALVVDLSESSITDAGKTYTRVQVNVDAGECFCFEEGKPKLADEYADVSRRVLPKLKDMPLLGVSTDCKGTERVYLHALPILGGTHQGIMMPWADLHYQVHPSSLQGFRAPAGFSLKGLSYVPSQLRFWNAAGKDFLAWNSHRNVQLTGGVMWHGGYHSDMLVTVQDMLRLVKVARLELTGAGRNARARLTVQRLADTEYVAKQRRQPGLRPPAGEVLMDLNDSNAEKDRQNKLSWRAHCIEFEVSGSTPPPADTQPPAAQPAVAQPAPEPGSPTASSAATLDHVAHAPAAAEGRFSEAPPPPAAAFAAAAAAAAAQAEPAGCSQQALALPAVLHPAADAAAPGRDQDVLGAAGAGTAAAAAAAAVGGAADVRDAADEPPAKRLKQEQPGQQQQPPSQQQQQLQVHQQQQGGVKQQRVYSQLQLPQQQQQQQSSQGHPPWQVISVCNELGNGLGAAFLQSDYWLEVPQQLQDMLCDEFPVGLTCSSPVSSHAAAAGGGSSNGGGVLCLTGSSTVPAAVPAVHVVDALGREVAIGGVQLPVLLHLCSSGNSAGSALCIDLMLLLAAESMPQGDLDSIAEKLAVKMISLAQVSAAKPDPGRSGQLAGLGAVKPDDAVKGWHRRLENILSKPAVKQQLLQHQNKVQHLQKLLSLI